MRNITLIHSTLEAVLMSKETAQIVLVSTPLLSSICQLHSWLGTGYDGGDIVQRRENSMKIIHRRA